MRSVNASMNRLMIGALLAIAFSCPAFAADKKPAAQPAAPATKAEKAADEKVDISDLENKYWAPKDTDFSVVQNRTYTKDHRFFASLQYGLPISDSYSEGSLIGVTGNYFLSERHGLQLTYLKASMKPNQAISDFQNISTGVYPDHGHMNWYGGAAYNFVPFYSKMSFMGKRIIYFDMAVSPTLGMTNYEQLKQHGDSDQSALTYGFDVTQYFFFSNHWAFRLDWKNQWYSQKVVKYHDTSVPTPSKEGDPASTKLIHDSLLLFGATFFF